MKNLVIITVTGKVFISHLIPFFEEESAHRGITDHGLFIDFLCYQNYVPFKMEEVSAWLLIENPDVAIEEISGNESTINFVEL